MSRHKLPALDMIHIHHWQYAKIKFSLTTERERESARERDMYVCVRREVTLCYALKLLRIQIPARIHGITVL